MNKKKINIGLDIGVASVGWSIIDENNDLINYGSRLFDDAGTKNDGMLANQARRSKRSLRRRLRRTKTRKEDFLKLLIKHNYLNEQKYDEFCDFINEGIVDENNESIPIAKIKHKGLYQKLSLKEAILCLFHYIHNRGYFYITEEDLSENDNKNKDLNANKHPTEIQIEFFNKNGYYRANKDNALFSNAKWTKEIEQFLKNQDLNEEFKKEYLNLFKRVRDFSKGPGSLKSPSKYGLYRFDKKENKVNAIGDNLWDITIGKCSVYKDINRGGKNSPIAEIFNLLNDLNNLYFLKDRNNKFSTKQKQEIFEYFNNSLLSSPKKSLTEKLIVEIFNKNKKEKISFDDVNGYRIDTKQKPLFTKLENTMTIAFWMIENKLVEKIDLTNLEDIAKINDVFCELAKTSDIIKRIGLIQNKYNVDEKTAENLVKKVKGVMQTHSLSYQAMLEYIPIGIEFIDENNQEKSINQMQYFSTIKNIFDKSDKFDNQQKKYISKNIFDNEIISPTARRAFIQTINVLNKIFKLYSKEYDINNITIELAREKNSSEEAKKIQKSIKNNAQEIEEVLKWANLDDSYKDKLNSKTKLKLKLLKEQDYKDIYTGNEIDVLDVINNPQKYQEEHIIPYSICFIDARYNKVLTTTQNNAEKGNRTPYEWLNSKGKYEEFKNRVNSLKISKVKKEFLLFEQDPRNELMGFIEKNLCDTRNISVMVLNTLQAFFKINKQLYPFAKIKVINGSITNYARYNLFGISEEKKGIIKKREEYEHHGVDATILAFLGSNHKINMLTKSDFQYRKSNQAFLDVIDEETGEVIELNRFINLPKEIDDIRKISLQLQNMSCKFSRPIRNKNNIQLFNETIYSIRWKDDKKEVGNKIQKINLLKKDDNYDEYFDIDSNQKDAKYKNLLCYQEDRILFDHLQKIWKENKNFNNDKELTKNPFINYMKKNATDLGIDQKQEFRHVILFINGKKKFVRSLRYLNPDEKKQNNTILLKNHNNKAIVESLNVLNTRIYKNNKDKYVLLPINAKVLTFKNNKLVIDENKLNDVLNKMDISNKNYLEIFNGKPIIENSTNKLFYFNGGGNFNENKLEIKSMSQKNDKRMQTALSTIMQNYSFCELDELGNIYNIKKIEIN